MAEVGTDSETVVVANSPAVAQGAKATVEGLAVGAEREGNSHRVVLVARAGVVGEEAASEVVEKAARHMHQAALGAAVEGVRPLGRRPRLLRRHGTWSRASGVCTPCRYDSIDSPRS